MTEEEGSKLIGYTLGVRGGLGDSTENYYQNNQEKPKIFKSIIDIIPEFEKIITDGGRIFIDPVYEDDYIVLKQGGLSKIKILEGKKINVDAFDYAEFLQFIHDRLQHQHGDDYNVDFLIRLRKLIAREQSKEALE